MKIKNAPDLNNLLFYKTYFINSTIKQGRKLYSERMYHNMLGLFKKFSKVEPSVLFLKAFSNLLPLIGLIPIKVGSSTYSVPVAVGIYKKRLYAIKSVIKSIKTPKSNLNVYALAEVVYGASQGDGAAIERKKGLYEQGVDNAPYMRFLSRKSR